MINTTYSLNILINLLIQKLEEKCSTIGVNVFN